MDQEEDGKVFREALKTKLERLITMVTGTNQLVALGVQQPPPPLNALQRAEVQFISLRATLILVKHEKDWIASQHDLIKAIKALWNREEYHAKHKNGGSIPGVASAAASQAAAAGGSNAAAAAAAAATAAANDPNVVDYSHWKEPRIIVKILLEYFKQHKETEILLLFQLLRAISGQFLADFQFLKDYLENDVSC